MKQPYDPLLPPSLLLLLLLLLLFVPPFALSQSPPCPAGHYAFHNPRNSTCIPCPAGTYLPTSGAIDLDLCIECPPNTFSSVLAATSPSTCTPCPPGSASGPGANTCLRCRPGTRIQPCPFPRNIVQHDVSMQFFRGDCFFYPDGPYPFASRHGPQTPRCERCPPGTVSSQRNSLVCDRCRNGLAPNQDRTMCVPPTCPPGQGLMFGRCRRCGGGLIVDEDEAVCTACPNGQVARVRRGERVCTACPEGTARLSDGFCSGCGAQENHNVTGAQFCLPAVRSCPPNFFVAQGGACHTCSKRQRYEAGSNSCVSCPRNSLSNGGVDTRCRRCPRGMIASPYEPVCECQIGWGWIPGSGRTRCRKCRPGTFSWGDKFCTPCDPDSFAPTAGLLLCSACGNTEAQPRYGQRRCVRRRCPRGLIPSGHAGCVLPTTNCPPGHDRQLNDGLLPHCVPTSAESCSDGTVLIRRDFEPNICGICGRGEKYDRDRERCVSCPTGTTSGGGIVETCEACPRGLQFVDGECRCVGGRKLIRGRCVRCPRGTYGFYRVDGCVPCPVGTASNRVGKLSSCEVCPAGKFAANPGSIECQDCPEGSTTFGIGESGCFTLA